MDDEDDDFEVAASDIEIVVYGSERPRSRFLDLIEATVEAAGHAYTRDDHSVTWTLGTDAASALDEIAGAVGDPPAGCTMQALVVDHEGDSIPISHAWQEWEELFEDVDDHLDEYLARYGKKK